MASNISEADAELALSTIDVRRRQVIAEVDVPWWYWWLIAAGWVAMGVISDLGIVWASIAAVLAFGAAHSMIAHRALSGRHRSGRLSVRAEAVSQHIPMFVLGFLVLLVVVTVPIAMLLAADGADHPCTVASVIVALAVLGGGPRLMAAMRRRIEERTAA
jgi:hypothetical protein